MLKQIHFGNSMHITLLEIGFGMHASFLHSCVVDSQTGHFADRSFCEFKAGFADGFHQFFLGCPSQPVVLGKHKKDNERTYSQTDQVAANSLA